MDESWNHLQHLEAHLKEHNTHIEKIAPLKNNLHSRQSSVLEELTRRPAEAVCTEKMLLMAKELREKDLEIMYLKRDVASLQIYKDQCINMQGQIKLLREKAVLCEREAQNKTTVLSNIESTVVPRVSQLQNELNQAVLKSENIEKLSIQYKKELDEKAASYKSLKQSISGQENSIKGLEDEKRMLKQKNLELQTRLEEILKKHENNIEHLKNKDQLNLALEEDNERLRAQIENTMESLQKCQYELSMLPKLRQDIHQREQLVSAASREIEREKSLRVKAVEDKEKIENQLAALYEVSEGSDPAEYIHELKNLISQSARDQNLINEEILKMKRGHELAEIENSELLKYTSECIEDYCKNIGRLIEEPNSIEIPELDESVRPVLEPLYTELQKAKDKMLEKLSSLREKNEALSDRIAKYEKNQQIRQKMEEMEELIQKQEFLTEQLSAENCNLKEEVQKTRDELNEAYRKSEKLETELSESVATSEALKKNYNILKKELEEKISVLGGLKQTCLKKEAFLEALEEEKKDLEEEKDCLEDKLKAMNEEKKTMHQKFEELQQEFEIFLNKHEKIVEKNKKQEEFINELKEDIERTTDAAEKLSEENNRLKEENEAITVELENQLKSIEKCRVDILPIKKDASQKNQQINVLTAELEKEKEKVLKVCKEKEELEERLKRILKITENSAPVSFIQNLKSEISGLNKEKKELLERISEIEKSHKSFTDELAEALQKEGQKSLNIFLKSEIQTSKYEGKTNDFIQIVLGTLRKTQKLALDKIAEQEENIEFLNEQIFNCQKNDSIREKIEENERLIKTQGSLCVKLAEENKNLKNKLDFANEQLQENAVKMQEIDEEKYKVQEKYEKSQKKSAQIQKELDEKSQMLNTLASSYKKIESSFALMEGDRNKSENEKMVLEEEMRCLKEETSILIEDKKQLNSKLLKLQSEFENIFRKQDLHFSSIKGKKEMINALIEDNEDLRRHVKNTLDILNKYRI